MAHLSRNANEWITPDETLAELERQNAMLDAVAGELIGAPLT